MNYEHSAYFDMDFLLAACLMDDEERKAVRNVMELKYKNQKQDDSDNNVSKASSTVSMKRPAETHSKDNQVRSKIARVEEEQRPMNVIKKEAIEEVSILNEQEDVPVEASNSSDVKENDDRITFKCEECDKPFVHRKNLQAHLIKSGHTKKKEEESTQPSQIINPTSNNEFKCQVEGCKYAGSKKRDLYSHMSRMHKSIKPKPQSPMPPRSDTPPAGEETGNEENLFQNMAKSWSKKKLPPKTPNKRRPSSASSSVKKEPLDQSKDISLSETCDSYKTVNSSLSSLPDSSENESDLETSNVQTAENVKTVEDTTFVAIDGASKMLDSETVDISKSKYFKANPQTVEILGSKVVPDQFCDADDKFPRGWKVKETIHEFKSGRKNKRRTYLTPDFKVLKTGIAVVEYMRLSGKCSAKEIMDYAHFLEVPVTKLEKYMELYL